jgi:hypothetical protein
VLGWNITAADPEATDRVGVIILLDGLKDTYMRDNVQYVIRSVARRLGPHWALQIFHGPGQQQEIAKVLGNPPRVTFTEANVKTFRFDESNGYWNYNRFRWSPDFYEAIHHEHEHVLIFELDSLLLRSDCVDDPEFLKYPMIGAPGDPSSGLFPEGFMNGGFTLRKRSTMLRALQNLSFEDALNKRNGSIWEDNISSAALENIGEIQAPKEVAMRFAMEQLPGSAPCGFHKPWIYPKITASTLEAALHQSMNGSDAERSTTLIHPSGNSVMPPKNA